MVLQFFTVYIGVGTVQLVNARIEKNKVMKATWDAVRTLSYSRTLGITPYIQLVYGLIRTNVTI